MATHGANLQSYNNELVKTLESIKEKRDEVSAEIAKQQEEKYRLEQQIAALNDKLTTLNRAMQENVEIKNSYEKTISDTEGAYMKILESSQTLLQVLKREGATLMRKTTKGTRTSIEY